VDTNGKEKKHEQDRADLYQGQPCPKTGGAYVFNAANGYDGYGL